MAKYLEINYIQNFDSVQNRILGYEKLEETFKKLLFSTEYLSRINGLIEELEFDELFDEDFNPYRSAYKGSHYFNIGTLHNEISEYIHEDVLKNVTLYNFNKNELDSIVELEKLGQLCFFIHELILNSIIIFFKVNLCRRLKVIVK